MTLEAPVISLKSPKSRLAGVHATPVRASDPNTGWSTASGPDHEKSFRVEVWVDGELLGVGEGSSRREAETAAAAVAIESIRAARETRDPAVRPRTRVVASA